MKSVLILGAGLVSPPLVRYFLPRRDYRLIVAAADFSRVLPLVEGQGERVRLVPLDVSDRGALDELIAAADLVVSLVPAVLLGAVADAAVRARKPLVSTSYQPPEVEALDRRAREAGLILLNEIGFDPGIDHMAVARTLRDIRARGGRVGRFTTAAGGIPAQDANNNPWGYKFSWNPRAVVLAGRNPARFLRGGEVVEIAGEDLFRHHWPYGVEGEGVFEVYANRDSLVYRDHYDLREADGVFRGTIRYPGWCDTMLAAARLGFFEMTEQTWEGGTTWGAIVARRIGHRGGSLVQSLADFLHVDADSPVITRLEWAGFLSDRPLPATVASPLDLFVSRLAALMHYQPGERDMAMLQYRFDARFPGEHREEIRGGIVLCGDAWGDTAMSRLVSLPAAIAARLILEGTIRAEGAVIPTSPEIYRPVLDELEELGISVAERRTTFHRGPLD